MIRSLPSSVAQQASHEIALLQQGGERASAIAQISVLRGVARKAALRLARTETSKATTALTRARADYLDLPWYVWTTSHDQRVRDSHRHMSNVLVRFDDPPAPERLKGIKSRLGHYNAGDAPNDRCYPAVLMRFSDVSWPHKVYFGDRIVTLTLAQFRSINSNNIRFLKEAA